MECRVVVLVVYCRFKTCQCKVTSKEFYCVCSWFVQYVCPWFPLFDRVFFFTIIIFIFDVTNYLMIFFFVILILTLSFVRNQTGTIDGNIVSNSCSIFKIRSTSLQICSVPFWLFKIYRTISKVFKTQFVICNKLFHLTNRYIRCCEKSVVCCVSEVFYRIHIYYHNHNMIFISIQMYSKYFTWTHYHTYSKFLYVCLPNFCMYELRWWYSTFIHLLKYSQIDFFVDVFNCFVGAFCSVDVRFNSFITKWNVLLTFN